MQTLLQKISVTAILLLLIINCKITKAQVAANNATTLVNSAAQAKKPYIILISGDGFRYDYAEKYQAKNLLKLSSKGVRAKYMIPSYPSVTHPNHYAMVSGLYPGHSGIAGNSFFDLSKNQKYKAADGSWFEGESIWLTAQKQQMLTANFNWVNGRSVTKTLSGVYQHKGGKNITVDDRVTTIKNWLNLPEAERPHLITMYFYDTDHAGHVYGPDAPETAKAVKEIDEAVGRIAATVNETGLPVNFIFVSDHGMINIDKEHPIAIPAVIDTAKFVINNQNSLVNLYAKDASVVTETYKKLKAEENGSFKAYLNADFPAELHYGGKDDRYHRAGDIILMPVSPKTFNPKPGSGAHGYNPYQIKEMGATFMAWGPAFKQGITIEPFNNVEVYRVLTSILELEPAQGDATGKIAQKILK